MKKKQSLINLLSCILVIMVIGIIINSNKFTSKYMTSNKYFNLLNNSVDTDDIVELIENLKTSNNTKKEEVKSLSDRVKALSSNTIGSADALNKIYPIGSIYISTTLSDATQVHNAIGGTWEVYGAGKVLRGTTDSNEVGTSNSSTGSVTLATGNLPSHSHSLNNHTHTISGNTAAGGAHSHTVSGTSEGGGAHSHTVSGTSETSAWSHTHTFTTPSQQANLRIDDAWIYWWDSQAEIGGRNCSAFGGGTGSRPGYVEIPKLTGSAARAGTHSHSISSGSAGSAGTHSHTISSGSAGSSGAHTHTFSITSGKASGNTSSTGKGSDIQAFSVIDPYITVYMYRRTA